MTDSQYAVFPFDVKTMMAREGQPLIFDSLAEAERYSKDKVAGNPDIGFQIRECNGKLVATVNDPALYERFHGQPAARRSIWIGLANLVAGLILIGIDVRFGLRLILPFLLGFRFVWVAAVKLIEGYSALKTEHNKK